MKKLLTALFALALLLCAAIAEDAPRPDFLWERDPVNHWQLDAAGALVNQGAHTMDEETQRCTVCGCELLDWGDGEIDVTDYDEYYNVLRYTSYQGGEVATEIIHLYTYNEDGLVLTDKEYVDGVLYGDSVFIAGPEGEQIPVKGTYYNDDGTVAINEYDEHGNCTYAALFDDQGAVIFENISEYALNDQDWYYECKTTSRFDTGETFYSETNQYGDPTRTLNTYADGTPWADTVYEYAYEEGVKLWCKQYSFGALTWEEHYDEFGNCIQETEYLEDGGTIVTQTSEQGDASTITEYAPDGTVLSVSTVEYEYNDNEEPLAIRIYTDGALEMETLYQYDEEVGMVGARETVYLDDGAYTVCEYDGWMTLLTTTVYAADGSVISVETADAEE